MKKLFAFTAMLLLCAAPLFAEDKAVPDLPMEDAVETPTPEEISPPVDVVPAGAPPSLVKKDKEARKKANDEAGIIKAFKGASAAWATGNARAVGKFFTNDASLVNPMGHTGWGHQAVVKIIAADLKHFEGSTQTFGNFKILFVLPNLALVDTDATLSGVENPDGSNTTNMHVYAVVVNRTGKWQARALRVTAFLKPPAPAGAVAPAAGASAEPVVDFSTEKDEKKK